MADTIKCTCSNCGAKYRLPLEAQGRTARCKRCGEKFKIPLQQSLEDSIMAWLANPSEEDREDDMPAKPRVINMPANEQDEEAASSRRPRGTIRMKESESGEDAKATKKTS